MASVNKVFLLGNLTRDPELKYSSGGAAVCKFGIATNESWYDKATGKREEKATFLRVTTFGKQGETCAQYLTKGRSVFIEGRLQSSSWETDDGQKRSAVEVVAQRVQFLGGKRNDEDAMGGPLEPEPEADPLL